MLRLLVNGMMECGMTNMAAQAEIAKRNKLYSQGVKIYVAASKGTLRRGRLKKASKNAC